MFNTTKIISKSNLQENIEFAKQKSHKSICAVVKANAYGNGVECVVGAVSNKVKFFAVANLNEALEVRKINKNKSILILGYCNNIEFASENNISITIDKISQIKKIIKLNKKIKIHIKINTGMNRLGLRKIKEFKQIINLIKKNKNIIFEGIYTHFFSSKNKLINKKQMNKFIGFIDLIPKKYNPIKHVGGSNLIYEELPKQIDMVRVGLFMYGYGAIDATPVMKVVTKIVNIINIKKGDYVGYDENFRATKKMTIAVIPLGYADGISREISHKIDVVVNGKKCKVLGLVCMDMFMIDISQTPANIGDEICVFYNATIWAEKLNQSEYEVLTSLNKMRANYLLVE